MDMKIVSLFVSIIGIFILLLLSYIIPSEKVSSLSQLELNKRVITSGIIKYIKNYNDFSVIRLDNNITITCNCNFSINKSIKVEGKVTEYKGVLQINAERIHLTD